jgi:hypothetical protein
MVGFLAHFAGEFVAEAAAVGALVEAPGLGGTFFGGASYRIAVECRLVKYAASARASSVGTTS